MNKRKEKDVSRSPMKYQEHKGYRDPKIFQSGRKKEMGIRMALDFSKAIPKANGTMPSKEGHQFLI